MGNFGPCKQSVVLGDEPAMELYIKGVAIYMRSRRMKMALHY